MIFLLRKSDGALPPAGTSVKISRPTPPYAEAGTGRDYFCAGDEAEMDRLRQAGETVVALNDGWYEVGGGGVAIWGKARHWEIRDTPFTVVERSPLEA